MSQAPTPKGDRIFVGKKPLHVYESAALAALKNHPSVKIIARGLLINNAIIAAENVRAQVDGVISAVIGVEKMKNKIGRVSDVPLIELVVSPKVP